MIDELKAPSQRPEPRKNKSEPLSSRSRTEKRRSNPHNPGTGTGHAVDSFLPDFCSLQTAFTLVVSSESLAFVLTLADSTPSYGFWSDLGLRSLFILWITLSSGAILCGIRPWLVRLGALWSGIATFSVIQAATLLMTWLTHDGPLSPGAAVSRDPIGGAHYLKILGVSGVVTAAWLRYLYVQSRWRRQIRAEGEARLDALQARMRPHFLFNSLNTIASLTRNDPKMAEELLLDLAELFRAVLRKEAKWVKLKDEVDLTCQYLNIERQRLGQRLRVDWRLTGTPKDALIPPLSIQPLVENAIYHGIEPSQAGGKIVIDGQLTKRHLVLTVKNTLPESDTQHSRRGTKQALANLRARLEACFPGEARLLTSVVDNCYQVRMVFPYLRERYENPDRRR
ncbi:two-component system, LytTR family, sensor histidine kinase AlgZ [Methylocaldum szegediense]|uniref:Two-component system, LytTR family, sensor histidine kinase AlgZ n=1 Tax=Methylocaldum szegediense TaxID=73780 RepID=A0ABM9I720_9GAMM|nr:two-component system, LytTR family, sensor histidine kinase AlgZ [Methylocaldum szegediense]